jgi:hypothetical protein
MTGMIPLVGGAHLLGGPISKYRIGKVLKNMRENRKEFSWHFEIV